MSVSTQESTFHMTYTVIYYEITEKNAFMRGRTTASTVSSSNTN